MGGPRHGNGLYGIAQAAAEAGVTTVIASLWPVNDAYAAVFMSSLYRGIAERREAGDVAVDLRELVDASRDAVAQHWAAAHSTARAKVRDGRDLIIPNAPRAATGDDLLVHWAPFVLLGDPILALAPVDRRS